MKKTAGIISLLLCLVMILGCFAACGEKEKLTPEKLITEAVKKQSELKSQDMNIDFSVKAEVNNVTVEIPTEMEIKYDLVNEEEPQLYIDLNADYMGNELHLMFAYINEYAYINIMDTDGMIMKTGYSYADLTASLNDMTAEDKDYDETTEMVKELVSDIMALDLSPVFDDEKNSDIKITEDEGDKSVTVKFDEKMLASLAGDIINIIVEYVQENDDEFDINENREDLDLINDYLDRAGEFCTVDAEFVPTVNEDGYFTSQKTDGEITVDLKAISEESGEDITAESGDELTVAISCDISYNNPGEKVKFDEPEGDFEEVDNDEFVNRLNAVFDSFAALAV